MKIKKAISVLVTSSLIVSIINLPVFSYTTVSPTKYSQEYNLQKGYMTPAQAAKQAIKKQTSNTTDTKQTTSTNAAVKQTAQQCNDSIDKSLKVAGNDYIRNWLNKAKTLIINKLNSNETDSAKQTWLNKALKTLQAIEKDKDTIVAISEQTLSGVFATTEMRKTIQQNITFNIVEKYGRIGVNLTNSISKQTGISKVEIFKLLKETKLTKQVITSTNGSLLSFYQQVYSGKYSTAKLETAIKASITRQTYQIAQQCVDIINRLSKTAGNDYIKNWLNTAKTVITKKIEGIETDSIKQTWMKKALVSLQAIEKEETSMTVLSEQTLSGVFATTELQKVLKSNITYNIVATYGRSGLEIISKLVKQTGISKVEIFKLLKETKLTKQVIASTNGSSLSFYQQVYSGKYSTAKLETAIKASITRQTYQIAQQCIDLINNLSKAAGNDYIKNWLNTAKTVITKKIEGMETDSIKQAWIKKALISLQVIEKENASMTVLSEQTLSGIFATAELQKVLKSNITYNIVATYGRSGVQFVDKIAKETGISKVDVFKIFKEIGVTKGQITNISRDITSYNVYKSALANFSDINKLLSSSSVESLAKTWLTKAKELIKTKINGKDSNATKQNWLKKVSTSIQAIVKAKASIWSLTKECYDDTKVFSSLKSVLKEHDTYKSYEANLIKQQCNNIITRVLNAENDTTVKDYAKKWLLDSSIKQWLNKAKELINDKYNGKESGAERKEWMIQALTLLQEMENNKNNWAGWRSSLIKATTSYQFCMLTDTIADNSDYSRYLVNSFKEYFSSEINDLLNNKKINASTKTWLTEVKDKINVEVIDNSKILNSEKATLLFDAIDFLKDFKTFLAKDFSSQKNTINNLAQQSKTIITNLKNTANISNLVKNWLDKASALIDEIKNGTKSNIEKEILLKKALNSIQKIEKEKGSMLSISEQTVPENSAFSSLKNIIENDSIYKIVNTINNIQKGDIENTELYKIFKAEVKTLIENKINGNESNSDKQKWLKKALTSLQEIENKGTTVHSLVQQVYFKNTVFSTTKLKNLLKEEYADYKYKEKEMNLMRTFAQNLNLAASTVIDIFRNFGISQSKLEKGYTVRGERVTVSDFLLDYVSNKIKPYIACGTYAVAAYLDISKEFAAVMNLASEIAINPGQFMLDRTKNLLGNSVKALINTVRNNGHYNIKEVYLTVDEFTNSMQAGEKALLAIRLSSGGGHAITVKKYVNGTYGVFDYGKTVIVTKDNFQKLINGQAVSGKTIDGEEITFDGHYSSTANKIIRIVADSNALI